MRPFRPKDIHVLGLLGKAGSGKSTAAQHLVKTVGAVRVSLAGPLKEIAKVVWEFSDDQVYGDAAIKEMIDPRWNMSPRVALQRLGNSARKFIDPEVWITACFRDIQRRAETNAARIFIIDDCRYINEAAAIATTTMFSGRVVRIDCPVRDSGADPLHPSEAEIDRVPHEYIWDTLVNDKTLTFFDRLELCVRSLWKP